MRIYELIYGLAALMENPDVEHMLRVLRDGTRYEHLLRS